jgi:hypothetical protein
MTISMLAEAMYPSFSRPRRQYTTRKQIDVAIVWSFGLQADSKNKQTHSQQHQEHQQHNQTTHTFVGLCFCCFHVCFLLMCLALC